MDDYQNILQSHEAFLKDHLGHRIDLIVTYYHSLYNYGEFLEEMDRIYLSTPPVTIPLEPWFAVNIIKPIQNIKATKFNAELGTIYVSCKCSNK